MSPGELYTWNATDNKMLYLVLTVKKSLDLVSMEYITRFDVTLLGDDGKIYSYFHYNGDGRNWTKVEL
jgi:hypothetical protein